MIIEFLKYLFDPSALMGWSGTTLVVLAGLIGDVPAETGLVGLLVVAASIYQKVRTDRRKQARHEKFMELLDKMIKGEMEYDSDFAGRFLDDEN